MNKYRVWYSWDTNTILGIDVECYDVECESEAMARAYVSRMLCESDPDTDYEIDDIYLVDKEKDLDSTDLR